MNNNVLKWAGWFLVCIVLQSTLVPHIRILSIKPDLLLLVLFLMSTKAGVMAGVYVGFFIGLGQDLFSPDILGQNALAKTVAGFFAGLFNERVMRMDPVTQAVLLIIVFLINDTLIMAVQMVKTGGETHIVLGELLMVTLPRALYSLLLAALPFIWTNIIRPARR
ncbi:MAG: rod shape-determining protein MreD [Chitinispirillales bacterium]|jgi:rod shape-determining protein MreD|nr:rod shape-determining protein MreD [Chitinispirillales bacterium]